MIFLEETKTDNNRERSPSYRERSPSYRELSPTYRERSTSSSLAQRLKVAANEVVKKNRGQESIIFKELRHLLVKPILIWITWLTVGTVFYTVRDAFTVLKGFYFAGKLFLNNLIWISDYVNSNF